MHLSGGTELTGIYVWSERSQKGITMDKTRNKLLIEVKKLLFHGWIIRSVWYLAVSYNLLQHPMVGKAFSLFSGTFVESEFNKLMASASAFLEKPSAQILMNGSYKFFGLPAFVIWIGLMVLWKPLLALLGALQSLIRSFPDKLTAALHWINGFSGKRRKGPSARKLAMVLPYYAKEMDLKQVFVRVLDPTANTEECINITAKDSLKLSNGILLEADDRVPGAVNVYVSGERTDFIEAGDGWHQITDESGRLLQVKVI